MPNSTQTHFRQEKHTARENQPYRSSALKLASSARTPDWNRCSKDFLPYAIFHLVCDVIIEILQSMMLFTIMEMSSVVS